MPMLDRGDRNSPSEAAATTGMEAAGSQLRAPLPDDIDCDLLALRSEDGAWHSATLYKRRGHTPREAIVIMHPAASFMQHYSLAPFARMGFAAMGISARFVAESDVIMEQCLLDVASSITYLHEIGCERVTLVGNSGGGGLMSFYQAEAEQPTVTETPAGDPLDLTQADLPPADAIVLFNAHEGRPRVLTDYLDPSVIDEADPVATDPSLDMFDPANGPPYSDAFLTRYRAAQVERNNRITEWAQNRLKELESLGIRDQAFIVHRTLAAPEFLDLSIDPSDRPIGWYGGPDVKAQNEMASSMARFNTLRSWLSSFGLATSNALPDKCLDRVSVPVLVVQGTADQGCFPRYARNLFELVVSRDKELHWIEGGNHFYGGQPELQEETLEFIRSWLAERNLGPDL